LVLSNLLNKNLKKITDSQKRWLSVIFFGSLCAFPQLKAKEAETNVFTLASASFTESTKRPRGFHVWFYCSYTKKMDYFYSVRKMKV